MFSRPRTPCRVTPADLSADRAPPRSPVTWPACRDDAEEDDDRVTSQDDWARSQYDPPLQGCQEKDWPWSSASGLSPAARSDPDPEPSISSLLPWLFAPQSAPDAPCLSTLSPTNSTLCLPRTICRTRSSWSLTTNCVYVTTLAGESLTKAACTPVFCLLRAKRELCSHRALTLQLSKDSFFNSPLAHDAHDLISYTFASVCCKKFELPCLPQTISCLPRHCTEHCCFEERETNQYEKLKCCSDDVVQLKRLTSGCWPASEEPPVAATGYASSPVLAFAAFADSDTDAQMDSTSSSDGDQVQDLRQEEIVQEGPHHYHYDDLIVVEAGPSPTGCCSPPYGLEPSPSAPPEEREASLGVMSLKEFEQLPPLAANTGEVSEGAVVVLAEEELPVLWEDGGGLGEARPCQGFSVVGLSQDVALLAGYDSLPLTARVGCSDRNVVIEDNLAQIYTSPFALPSRTSRRHHHHHHTTRQHHQHPTKDTHRPPKKSTAHVNIDASGHSSPLCAETGQNCNTSLEALSAVNTHCRLHTTQDFIDDVTDKESSDEDGNDRPAVATQNRKDVMLSDYKPADEGSPGMTSDVTSTSVALSYRLNVSDTGIKASIARAAQRAVSGYRSCDDADLYVGTRIKPTLILARAPPSPSGILRKTNRRAPVKPFHGTVRWADGRQLTLPTPPTDETA